MLEIKNKSESGKLITVIVKVFAKEVKMSKKGQKKKNEEGQDMDDGTVIEDSDDGDGSDEESD